MQNQRHFLWIFWTLRKHSFLSLALDIYSFRLKLLSPEVLECLCDRISHSEPSVFQFLSFSVYCVIILFLGHISISLSNFLQVSLLLLILTSSLNAFGLCYLPKTTTISFWIFLHPRWSYFLLLFIFCTSVIFSH